MGNLVRNFVVFLALLLIGCGGGGGGGNGSGGSTNATPFLKVDWPTRGRDVSGPSSALSVQFTLQPSSGSGIVINGDRPSGTAATVSTYTATSSGKTGPYKLTANFYASNGETGAIVGTVSENVSLSSSGAILNTNGTALSVAFTPVIKSAVVDSGQSVSVGSSITLTATAYDASSQPVVVTPGSFVYSGGNSNLTVAANGLATGVAIGTAPVTASIDGITSAAQTVTVTGKATAGILVDWPTRSRDVSAPSSALSVQFTLTPSSGSGSAVTIEGDRPSNLAPNTATYSSSSPVATGNYTLTGNFYTAAAEGGTVVGTVNIAVVLQADGTIVLTTGAPLIVTFTGVIANVVVLPNQLVPVGSTVQLQATSFDSKSNAVVVTPGSYIWSISGSSADMTLNTDGVANGLAAGSAQVVARIDNHNSSPTTVGVYTGFATPKLSVSWPTRSRQIGGPSSALSCSFTLKAGGITNPNVAIKGDRPSGTDATVTTYSASIQAQEGTYNLTGSFYAGAGESGAVVGTVSVSVSVSATGAITQPNGLPLEIDFTPVIKSAQVNPSQGVTVGSTAVLTASAFNAKGNVVVVSQGSFIFSLQGSTSVLDLAADGTITGRNVGSTQVQATIDGVTTPVQTVLVTPATTGFQSFAIDSGDIAYDSLHDTVWVSANATSGIGAGEVVPIAASTNTVGTPIAVGNAPTFLCLSSDNSFLYVGGANGTVVQVSLATSAITETIPLPTGTVPSELQALPGSPNSVVVNLVSSTNAQTDEGTYIYDGTTARSNTPQIGQWSTVSSDGSRIYGYQQYQSTGSLYTTASIDSTGITNTSSSATTIQGANNRIYWQNGNIVTDSGQVVSPDTGTLVGSLTFSLANQVAAPVAGTNTTYYAAYSPLEIQNYNISTFANVSSFTVGTISGTVGRAISAGPSRVALRTTGGSSNSVFIVSGLQ